MKAENWRTTYQDLIENLPIYVEDAQLTICGLSTFVDGYVRLHEADLLWAAAEGTPEGALGRELFRRASAGIGGEFYLEWPEGARWVDENLRVWRRGIGGSGAQAAQTLAVLGASALMNLEDRSWEQLSVIHPDILVATEGGLTRCGELPCGQGGKPAHYIFEFTAGKPLGPIVLKRSSRTIVRFQEEHLDRDPDFERESVVAAEKAGAGILSGFNEIGPQKIDESLRQAVALAETWRKRGLKTIHLEIGDYGMAELRGKVLEALSGVISSLGMNYAELAGFPGENRDTVEKAFQIAEKLHLARLCVHSDTWALTITTGDPQREYQALLCGCLLAAVRAEKGYPCQPAEVPVQAEFRPLRWEKFRKKGAWTVVSCAAPFLERPVGTIGLGDTFLAGNLLVLGGTPGAKADVGAKTIL